MWGCGRDAGGGGVGEDVIVLMNFEWWSLGVVLVCVCVWGGGVGWVC